MHREAIISIMSTVTYFSEECEKDQAILELGAIKARIRLLETQRAASVRMNPSAVDNFDRIIALANAEFKEKSENLSATVDIMFVCKAEDKCDEIESTVNVAPEHMRRFQEKAQKLRRALCELYACEADSMYEAIIASV